MDFEKEPAPSSFGTEDKTKDFKSFKARGGKPNRRTRRAGKFDKRAPRTGGNDFEFWNAYPELMSIATRFPWMHINGTPLAGDGVSVNLHNVAVQHYFSVPGVCKSATDPLNLAFRQLYLDMHRKYRGIGAYQASDIAIVLICIESVLQLIVEAERIYGIIKGYPVKSRVEPEGLLLAMGYTQNFVNSVKENLADYRYGINRIIELAKRLPLPAGMNFFRNHVALNGFVYRDSKDERSALLVFIFDNYYEWTTANDSDCINSASTAVNKHFVRSSILDYKALFAIIETQLTKLLTDTDVLKITSDFIACYGENNMQVLTALPEDYIVTPMYSETILHKWHNSMRYKHVAGTSSNSRFTYKAVGSTTQLTSFEFAVYQKDDVIYSLPVLSTIATGTAWALYGADYYVTHGTPAMMVGDFTTGLINDSWYAEPSQELICESVLWKQDAQALTISSKYAIELLSAGTEVMTRLDVYPVVFNSTGAPVQFHTSFTADNSGQYQYGLCQFDWAPLIFVQSSGMITSIQGDVDNVTTVGKDVVRKVLDAALLSAFKIHISGSARE